MTKLNKHKARLDSWDHVLDELAKIPDNGSVPVAKGSQKREVTKLLNGYNTYYREKYKSSEKVLSSFVPQTDEERRMSQLLPQFFVIKAVRCHKTGKPGMDTSLLPLFEFLSTKRCSGNPDYPAHQYRQELVMLQALMREAPASRTLEVTAKLADSSNAVADVPELSHVTQKGGYDPAYMRTLRTSARSVARQLDELYQQFTGAINQQVPEATDAPAPNEEIIEQLKQERQRTAALEKALAAERQRRQTAEAERDRATNLRDDAVIALNSMNNAQITLQKALNEIKKAIGGHWEEESPSAKAA